jgi:thiol-disulfide isomerase/thioredoxin
MQKADQAKTSDGVGQPLELSGVTAKGDKFKLEPYKGKVVLVFFWATWCPDCMAAMPGIKALYQKHKAEGFEIVGVDLDPQVSDLLPYIEKEKIGWTNIVGEGKEGSLEFPMAVKYYVTGTPSSLLVGTDGKILARNLEGEALAKKIEELLKDRSAAEKPVETKPTDTKPAEEQSK